MFNGISLWFSLVFFSNGSTYVLVCHPHVLSPFFKNLDGFFLSLRSSLHVLNTSSLLVMLSKIFLLVCGLSFLSLNDFQRKEIDEVHFVNLFFCDYAL